MSKEYNFLKKQRYEYYKGTKEIMDNEVNELVEDVADVLNQKDWNINELLKIKKFQTQKIAQLEEQLKDSIRPKFEIGQDVFVFDWRSQLRSGRVYEIQTNLVLHDQQPLITYLVDFYSAYEDDDQENDYYEEKDVFITKEEAESKLKELKGE